MPVTHVTAQAEFDNLVRTGVCVVDFFATWCGPCKAIAPKLEEMSNEMTNVKFLKVDVDEMEELAQKVGISCMPTFKIYKNNAVVDTLEGANVEALKTKIQAQL
eukprot:NODE_7072_length_469_cov_67.169591_g6906_i0.p2 GENE.NODE_7072_length_469_cov_67.169591_g6906_i0~~NODE_7072_length_469_cov_67.169591_g6906_i0.p2  ORF type:complete len:104 (+),score=34.06 NODE_7072_length_469_cov_67.169591_g6906_i0:63-374(+)